VQRYELVGTPPLSQIEVAEILGRPSNKPVRAEAEPIESWEHRARASRHGDHTPDTDKNVGAYARDASQGKLECARLVAGRPPTSLPTSSRVSLPLSSVRRSSQ